MAKKIPAKKRGRHLPEAALKRLRQAILTGELREGDRVRESRLAVDWGIGVTPLREAVRQMAAMGYLILEPNRAPVVRKLRVEDIREIYSLRELLECHALRNSWESIGPEDLWRLAALVEKVDTTAARGRRLDTQFALDAQLHGLWISPQKGPWLASIMDRLLIHRPNLTRVLSAHKVLVDEAFEEHRQILESLENRDLEQALERLGSHIRRSGSVLGQLIGRE